MTGCYNIRIFVDHPLVQCELYTLYYALCLFIIELQNVLLSELCTSNGFNNK